MSKTVYWAISNVTNMSPLSKALYETPEPLTNTNTFTSFRADRRYNNFRLCPAYLDHIHNTFRLKFPLDYDLTFDTEGVGSSLYDADFFNYFVNIRDFDNRYFGFKVNLIFFTEDDMDMSLMPPYLENTSLATDVVSVPGTFNIGKWFRPIDYAVFLKPGRNKLTIKKGDAFNYVKFHTQDKVELVQFDYVEELEKIQKDILRSKMILGTSSPRLDYFYKTFKNSRYKKKILNIIKHNILEE
jgi:hypothetical protein